MALAASRTRGRRSSTTATWIADTARTGCQRITAAAPQAAYPDGTQQQPPELGTVRQPGEQDGSEHHEGCERHQVEQPELRNDEPEPASAGEGVQAEAEVLQQRTRGRGLTCLGPVTDEHEAQGAGRIGQTVDTDRPSGTRGCNDGAGQDRPQDRGQGTGTAERAVGPCQLVPPNDLRDQAAAGRVEERAADPDQRRQHNDRRERRVAVDQRQGQRRLRHEAQNVGGDHDAPPRPAVAQHAAEQEQNDGRQRLCRQHEAERPGRATRADQREAERHRYQSRADGGQGGADEEQREVAAHQHRVTMEFRRASRA